MPDPGSLLRDVTDVTDDGFLGGRLRILQPRHGPRAAVDSVLLPAAIAPERGHEVLDAGLGIGVAALCLLARLPGLRVSGLEIQSELAVLARENARRNGFEFSVECGDLFAPPGAARFDQVMTNPPYHDEEAGTEPRDASKARAYVLKRRAGVPSLAGWIAACLGRLKPGGSLTLIHRADRLHEILAALAGGAGDAQVLPIVPKAGEAPHRVVVRARLGGTAAPHVSPPLVLHQPPQKYTDAAEGILRHAAPIDWADDTSDAAP